LSDFYPLAKGHMAEVWARCECPVCDDEIEHLSDEYEEDEGKKLHLDTYTCDHCNLFVTYVSPADVGEYHNVANRDRRYLIEQRI
jgi:C4-type Zn-finger protein